MSIVSNGTQNNDRFEASPGNDQIDGGEGSDIITGGAGNDVLHGGNGADTVIGGLGSDIIFGDAGNDLLNDSYGANNQMSGGDGDDQISMVYSGPYGMAALPFGGTIDGGAGNDLIAVVGAPSYSTTNGNYSSSINVFGGSGDDQVDYRSAVGSIDLGSGNDRLVLQYNNSFTPGQSVVITTGAGADTIGFDAYFGGHPYIPYRITDFTVGNGGDVVDLTAVLSNILSNWNGSSNPFSTGHLTLTSAGANTYLLQVDYDGSTGSYGLDSFITFENVNRVELTSFNFGGYALDGSAPISVTALGTAGDDFLTGGVGSDTIQGFAGDDILAGGFGNDAIDGGDGNDRISGGFGADILTGGAGNDVIVEQTRGGDKLYGGDGDDQLSFTSYSTYGVTAIPGDLMIDGGSGNDQINFFVNQMGVSYANSYKASIIGGAGIDQIIVGLMNGGGTIDAGTGNDRVEFQSNNTAVATIALGTGQDMIVINNSFGGKVVTDFKAGELGDRLEISGYSGGLSLTQIGTSTVVNAVSNGYSQTIVTLQNVKATDLSLYNLGFNSGVFSPVKATLTGTDGADDLTGADADDQILGGAGNDTLSGSGGNDILSGGIGNDFLIGGSGNDQLDGGDGFDTVSYADASAGVTVDLGLTEAQQTVLGSDTLAHIEGLIGTSFADDLRGNVDNSEIYGGAGNDKLSGGGGDDTLNGGSGDDVLIGGAGNDILDGGSGLDRASYDGLFKSFAPTNVNGVLSLRGGTSVGTDTVTGIETITFKDGLFDADPDHAAAQVLRLYDTVLQRRPDAIGLDFYVDRIEDRGVSTAAVAAEFLNSSEFQAATGALANSAFVDYVYQHALGRAADASGKAYYTGVLDNGGSRVDLLMSFSESGEHRGLTADAVAQGFFNTDDSYQAVALLFDSFANRKPDASGLSYYAERLKAGSLTLAQAATDFAGSTEFQQATDGLSNGQLVDYMYRNTLDREADAGGRAYYTNALDQGLSKGSLLLEFSQSQEHYNYLAGSIIGGIDVL